MQGAWAGFLVLVRTYNPSTGAFDNLYSNLLDYVVSADLLFYILTIAAVFRLRRIRPEDRAATTFSGLVIVLVGVAVYFAVQRSSTAVSVPSIPSIVERH